MNDLHFSEMQTNLYLSASIVSYRVSVCNVVRVFGSFEETTNFAIL
jgi:hypothetical protein